MTSKADLNEVFVWIWLPGEAQPVVAGKLAKADARRVVFNYARSYLDNPDAVPIYDRELPLVPGALEKPPGSEPLPGCIRDASPDAWGRRVILNKLTGAKGESADTSSLDEFTYLMESGSDRIGGLDFQRSATTYEPRHPETASIEDLLRMAEAVDRGAMLPPELLMAVDHGTSIGGARPKAAIGGRTEQRKYIAKFSSGTDHYNVIKAEFVAMRLAAECGLNVANVELATASGKDVLMVERFDRVACEGGWSRRLMLSALTLLDLVGMTARYASYEDLAEVVRHRFTEPNATLHELFGRMVFNILCGNTDDHARNHAAFWNGSQLTITPAYDICPQLRSGGEASQAMMIAGNDRSSRLATCLAAAKSFMLDEAEAQRIITAQVDIIEGKIGEVIEEAGLPEVDRELFKGRLFLNPYAFEGFKD